MGQYAIGFVGSILISRVLGPEGRGIYALPVVAAATLTSIVKLGIEQANVFLYGTAGIDPARLSRQNGLVAAVMGVVGVGALLAAPGLAPSMFSDTPSDLMWMAALTIPFSLHLQFTSGVMTMMGRVTWQFTASFIAGVAQVALVALLYALGRITPEAVLATTLFSIVLTWFLIVLRFRAPGNRWIGVDRELLSMTLRQSLPLHLGMVLLFLHMRADAFLVKAIRGSADLGIYSVSVMLAETMYLAMDSIAVSMVPRQLAGTASAGARDALRAGRVVVLVGGGVALLWVALGWPILRVFFGEPFLPAYPALILLLPGVLALGIQRVCGPAVLREGKPGRMGSIYAASLALNLILNVLLIPRQGIVGAALSSAISYCFGAFLFLRWTASIGERSLLEGILPTMEDVRYLGRSLSQIAASTWGAIWSKT